MNETKNFVGSPVKFKKLIVIIMGTMSCFVCLAAICFLIWYNSDTQKIKRVVEEYYQSIIDMDENGFIKACFPDEVDEDDAYTLSGELRCFDTGTRYYYGVYGDVWDYDTEIDYEDFDLKYEIVEIYKAENFSEISYRDGLSKIEVDPDDFEKEWIKSIIEYLELDIDKYEDYRILKIKYEYELDGMLYGVDEERYDSEHCEEIIEKFEDAEHIYFAYKYDSDWYIYPVDYSLTLNFEK